jgi:hypothetical protein
MAKVRPMADWTFANTKSVSNEGESAETILLSIMM